MSAAGGEAALRSSAGPGWEFRSLVAFSYFLRESSA
jgi:hypothetical protein